jgi:ubiquinol-cytochrome c reductase cytochrome b subunit
VLGCPTDNDHFIVYYYKDVFVLVVGFCVVGCCVFVFSDTLHHSDNFLVVDPLVTPRHIVPEWYFLVWYSVLRCVSSKALGVFLLGFCVVVFLFNALVSGSTRYAHSSVDLAETSVTL